MQNIQRLLPVLPKGWGYELVYKSIRHIYFRIHPDKKIVRISAPSRINPEVLKQAITSKSAWLMTKTTAADNNKKPPSFKPLPAMTQNCSCMIWGRQIAVERRIRNARPEICLTPDSGIIIQVPSDYNPEKEGKLWDKWLRTLLNRRIEILLEKWQPAMGVVPTQFRLKKMKTRWGSCNTVAKRIWINAALVHLESCLLEYVLVHELVHLIEPAHTQRFYQILEAQLPDWKAREVRLNQTWI